VSLLRNIASFLSTKKRELIRTRSLYLDAEKFSATKHSSVVGVRGRELYLFSCLLKDVLAKLYLFPSVAILLSYEPQHIVNKWIAKKWTVSFPVRNVYSEKMNDVLQDGHCPTYSLYTSHFKHSKTTYIVTTYLNTMYLVNVLNSDFGTTFTQKRRTELQRNNIHC